MNKLKNLRKEKGLTIADLHCMTGIPVRTLEDWDANKRSIQSYHRIKALAKVLGCDMDDLMTFEKHCLYGGTSATLLMTEEEKGIKVSVVEENAFEIVVCKTISKADVQKLLKYMKSHWDIKSYFM